MRPSIDGPHLSLRKAAEELCCAPKRLGAWINTGLVRSVRIGRCHFIPKTEVDRLMLDRSLDRSSIAGKRFGSFVAKRPVGVCKSRQILWLCRCDCGNDRVVQRGNLVALAQTHCGCRRRSGTRMLQAFGKTRSIAEWAHDGGMQDGTLRWRLRKGMLPEAAITTPVRSPKSRARPDRGCDARVLRRAG